MINLYVFYISEFMKRVNVNMNKIYNKNLFIAYNIILFILSAIHYIYIGHTVAVMISIYLLIILPYIYINVKKDVLGIGVVFILSYSLYILNIPLRMVFNIYDNSGHFLLANDAALVYKITFVGGICAVVPFIIAYTLFYKPKDINSKLIGELKENTAIFLFNRFLIFFGILMFILGVYKQGGIQYLTGGYVWNSTKQAEVGIMTTGFHLFITGILIEFYFYLTKLATNGEKFNLLKWKYTYISLIMVFIKFLQGGRWPVIVLLISSGVIYYYTYKKISFIRFLKIGIIALVIIGFVGYFRNAKNALFSNWGEIKSFILGKALSLEMFYDSYTVLTTTFAVMYSKIGYLYGLGLIDSLIFIVPRVLIPNKDNLLYTSKWIQANNSVVNISPVGGLNLAAQNIMNGYIIYTILFMGVLGYIFCSVVNRKNYNKNFTLFYSLAFPYLVLSIVRDPLYLSIKELITFALVPYVIILYLYNSNIYYYTDKILAKYLKVTGKLKVILHNVIWKKN